MSRYAKGRKVMQRHAHTHPFKAVACTSVCTLTAERIGQCVSAVTDRGTRSFAFRRKSARDQFVAMTETAEFA